MLIMKGLMEMKLTQEVYRLDATYGSYAYAVKTEKGVTLIDTGFPGRGKATLNELMGYGISPKDIKQILLTHGDTDHTGNIGYLASHCGGCPVYVGREDLPFVTGEKKFTGLRRVIGAFQRISVPPSLAEMPEGPLLDIEVIRTPGHTPGHCCFRFKNILFAGDIVRGKGDNLTFSPSYFTWDHKRVLRSLRGLDMDGIDWICTAHGGQVHKETAWPSFFERYLFQKQ